MKIMDVQCLQSHKMSILNLPTELIEHICCCDVLKMNDIFNLSLSHSKLNNVLFHEQNSCLWKSKYIQKYGQLDKNEFKITINEQNTWKDEIKLRMYLDKAVPFEILQMHCKNFLFKNIPYHLYPFSEKLNSKNQAHRYYVLSASAAYYKLLLNDNCLSKSYDLLYLAHRFLIYSCQVYYGYEIYDFLCLPPVEQTVEQGFYLLDRWWSPTVETPYCDINEHLNNIARTTYNLIQSTNPAHPLLEDKNCLNHLTQRGKVNLKYDLYDEPSTMFILDALRQVIFNDNEVCFCTEINCFLLHEVIKQNKGSVFLLCVIYESVARRLGVKVRLTVTSVHNFISWSSSWPGNKFKNPTCFLIDIACGGIMRKTSVCPVTRKLPDDFKGNSIPDLFWTFSKTMEQLNIEDVTTYKYVLDFQKMLRPNDPEVEYKCDKFHQYNEYCRCPILLTTMNSCEKNGDI